MNPTSRDKVLVTGGSDGTNALASVELYDPAKGTWQTVASLATARYYHTATLLASGQVLVAGGYSSSTNALATMELYDPPTNTWTSSAPSDLVTARYNHTATLLPSGKVLVASGYGTSDFVPTAELYDPASKTWSTASTAGILSLGRSFHTATLLPSGQALISGGEWVFGYLSGAELYNPVSNSWSGAGTMTFARVAHAATLLPSGELLVTGGANSVDWLSSVERYAFDLGFAESRRPQITSVSSPLSWGDSLQLTGSGFNGDSGASRSATDSSDTNSPLIQLRRIDNDQIAWTTPAAGSSRSDTRYSSAALPDLTPGPYILTMFVNGIPSTSQVIQVKDDRIFRDGFESVNP